MLLRVSLISFLCLCSGTALLTYIHTDPVYAHDYFFLNNTDYRQNNFADYYRNDLGLALAVNKTMLSLTDEELVGQLFMPAWDTSLTLADMKLLIDTYRVGGVMTLRRDVTTEDVQTLVMTTTRDTDQIFLRGLVSVDAEPSLIRYRLPSIGEFANTSSLSGQARVVESSGAIARAINSMGYRLNFAPVYDNGRNQSVIGNRAFSTKPDEIVERAGWFIDVHHESGVYATVKHFPGHGMVSGDTHKTLQTVDADLPELSVFARALDRQPVFMMVGHLAVGGGPYDTGGKPSTISQKVSSELLRDVLGYEGVVITDAMNMNALDGFDNVDLQALDAGADIVLMPRDLRGSYATVLERIKQDPEYRAKIVEKVSRIVRAKIISQWHDAQE